MELTSLTERPPIRIIARSLSLGQVMPELKDLGDKDPHGLEPMKFFNNI